jgi:hypothetical protein
MGNSQHVYLNRVILSKQEFRSINERINAQYDKFEKKPTCFNIYYTWALFATVSGLLTGYGNIESTALFLECVSDAYLPEVSIMGYDKDQVQVCICIKDADRKNAKSRSKSNHK